MSGAWHELEPREGAAHLSALPVSWWVAGGWAIDLFLGRVTRRHHDLDIGIFRRDAPAVFACLPEWDFFEARHGALTPLLAHGEPRPEVNSLWCRRKNSAAWELELMLDEGEPERWIFRRNRQIHRPLSAAVRHNSDAMPYLAPEIQLLYKARSVRARDQTDFENAVPSLDSDARAWLRDSLAATEPGHGWLSVLNAA